MFFPKKVLIPLLLLFNLVAYTQTRSCSFSDIKENNNIFQQNNTKYYEKTNKHRNTCQEPIILPVAIHFQQIDDVTESCLIRQVILQIEQLNQDFQGENTESSWWFSDHHYFSGIVKGAACLQFQIATQAHPKGYGLQNGEPAITINQTDTTFLQDWANYINIFVRPHSALGYAPYGGSGKGDGIIIDINAFGLGEKCGTVAALSPFDKGRTLTHEMGHYLFLKHIWGNEGCAHDDGVLDTPVSLTAYEGCPAFGETSCGSMDLHINFMDYVDDACMYMFTAGQVQRMEQYTNTNLTHLIESAAITTEISNNLNTNRIGERDLNLVVTPNPIVSKVTLRGRYPIFLNDESISLQLFDMMGRRLYAKRDKVAHNYHYFEVQLNLEDIQANIPTGTYFLHIEFANVRKTLKINKTNL